MGTLNPFIKVLFVTRVLPIENTTGAKSYVFDFLSYLKSKRFCLELTVADSTPGGRSPVLFIPSSLLNLGRLSVRNQIKLRRILIRLKSFFDLIMIPVGIFYNFLPEYKRKKFVNTCSMFASSFISKNGKSFLAIDTSPTIKNHPASPSECRFIRDRIIKFKPDVVIANYAWMTQALDFIANDSSILKVVLTHEVIHQRSVCADKLGIQWGNFNWSPEQEIFFLGKADLILTIQKEDYELIKKMLPQSNVLFMPMAARPQMLTAHQVPGRCLFVGSKGSTNVQGMQWFLDKVWPRILNALPHCSLHICGTVCNEINDDFCRVNLRGRVENLEKEYGAAEVCIAPLYFGSGLKIKLIEALSFGRASVTTNIGLQGLDELDGTAILRANTAEEFTSAVISILTDDKIRSQMESEALRYVREHLAPETVYQPVVETMIRHVSREIDSNN